MIAGLMVNHDLVFIQETKLSKGGQEEFRRWVTSLGGRVYFNGLMMGRAGTLIIETSSLTSRYSSLPAPGGPIWVGYIQGRRYTPLDPLSGARAFQAINAYFFTGLKKGEVQKDMFTRLLSVDDSVPTFLAGDLNFIVLREDTTGFTRSRTLTADNLVLWRKVLGCFSLQDIAMSPHTHFHTGPSPWSSP